MKIEDFKSLLREQMEELEIERLVAALDQGAQPTSIRVNPHKPYPAPEGREVEWCGWGRHLDERPSFTRDGLFQAGAYYVQEAASMFVGHILRSALGEEIPAGLRVLDMCAAPGGKSTLYSSIVGDRGLVVANEVIRNRALTLADNALRWGVGNMVVTSNDPSHFASSLVEWFDVVAVDAPCSGEGMFRKSEESRENWSLDNVRLCAARQRRIMADAWESLRPGGLFIYSTCTFNRDENESNMEWLCQEFECERVSVECPEEWGIVRTEAAEAECFHFYPHRTEGEGLFAAVVRKGGEGGRRRNPKARRNPFGEVEPKQRKVLAAMLEGSAEDWHFATIGESLYGYRRELWEDVRCVSEQMSVLFSGVKMGEIFGKKFKPDHSLALSKWLRRESFPCYELSEEELQRYLHREELGCVSELTEGVNLLLWRGCPVGFIKRIGGRTNTMLPKEFRIFI
ncbi:MAG: rRNA cytosine-C5-methylase [Tidjanibacter sp.]|nr:rRNA cytosine-C5-methylase [Tidjanibacter sp.]